MKIEKIFCDECGKEIKNKIKNCINFKDICIACYANKMDKYLKLSHFKDVELLKFGKIYDHIIHFKYNNVMYYIYFRKEYAETSAELYLKLVNKRCNGEFLSRINIYEYNPQDFFINRKFYNKKSINKHFFIERLRILELKNILDEN